MVGTHLLQLLGGLDGFISSTVEQTGTTWRQPLSEALIVWLDLWVVLDSFAELIVELWVLPPAAFRTVRISGSKVNGSLIGNFSPTEITMVNSSGQAKDSVSSLSGGTNFSATWLAAANA